MAKTINLNLDLNSLSDVDKTGVLTGQLFYWDGTELIPTGMLTLDTVTNTVTLNGDVSITGDAEILGTTTTIDTETLQAKDNNIVLNFEGTHLSANGGGITVEDGVSDGSDSSFQVNGDGNWYTLQDVGIGTSTPIEKLDVNGTIRGSERFRLQDGTGNSVFLIQSTAAFSSISAGSSYLNYIGSNHRFLDSSFNELVRIEPNGVGIGTSTPSEKLEVIGTIKATDINFTGLATFADDSAAGTGGLSSGDVYKTVTGELRIKL